jgi:hypothetical protein
MSITSALWNSFRDRVYEPCRQAIVTEDSIVSSLEDSFSTNSGRYWLDHNRLLYHAGIQNARTEINAGVQKRVSCLRSE